MVHFHPLVEPLAYILGTWRGQGQGGYPSIPSFSYMEELNFSNSPNKPFIAYSQKTWNLESGEPMHSESGFFRPKPDGTIEVVIAQSTGLVEVQRGSYDANERAIKLKSSLVGNAAKVMLISREYNLLDGELICVVKMATRDTHLQTHLKASLKKLSSNPT